jgi:hypothetical protein
MPRWCTLTGILSAHLAEQISDLARNDRPSGLAAPHLPGPEQPKAGTMQGSSSRAARERKIEDRVARTIVREMSIGESYERNNPIRLDISRFSRDPRKRAGELIQWSWRRPGTKPIAVDSLLRPLAGPEFLSGPAIIDRATRRARQPRRHT